MFPTKTIVITGATSGIGLAFIERLLLETKFRLILNICILCRNMRKGEALKSTLKLTHKTSNINLIEMDCENIKSVLIGAEKIKKNYSTIDYLFCNAGILPMSKLHYSVIIKSLFNGTLFEKLRTGHEIFSLADSITNENLNRVFATNVFGHFVLIQELLPILASEIGDNYSHIIWSASMCAHKKYFSKDDLMCRNGENAYSSSKQLMNHLSVALNLKYNSKNLYSSLAEPGLVLSGINSDILPSWLWTIVSYLFCMLRIFLPTLTIAPYYAAEVLVWLFNQNPLSLNKFYQYDSKKGFLGSAYVDHTPLLIDPDESLEIYNKMKDFEIGFRKIWKY